MYLWFCHPCQAVRYTKVAEVNKGFELLGFHVSAGTLNVTLPGSWIDWREEHKRQ